MKKIAAFIVVVISLSVYISLPAWDDCKAAGNSNASCFFGIQFWMLKRWGF